MFASSWFKASYSRSLNASTWLGGSWNSGTAASSGAYVTPETAIGVTAVYACVRLLAESVAQLPCNLYKKEGKEGRELAVNHQAYNLLNNAPNGWQTPFQYQEYQQGALGLRGNAFAYLVRNAKGGIEQMIPLNPADVVIRVDNNLMPFYDILSLEKAGVPFTDMHHVAAFGTNPYLGLSPIQAGKEAIGLGMSADQHAANLFANGTQVSGVLERPYIDGMKTLSEPQINQLRQKWADMYSGMTSIGKVAVLQDGFQFKPITMSSEDAQLLSTRVHSVNEIARLYNVPPHMIQLLDKATFSNIESQALQFVMYTLLPWLKRYEDAYRRDLLTTKERASYYFAFDVTSLMRGDTQTRYEAYAKARQWGWLSVNDIRRLENLPPIAGGDTYLQPLNMVDSTNKSAKGDKPKAAKNKPVEAEIEEILVEAGR